MPPSRSNRRTSQIALSLVLLTFLLSGVVLAAPDNDVTLYPSPTDRFGFGFVSGGGQNIADYDVARLNAGWYVNWGSPSQNVHPAGLHFVPMVRLCDDVVHQQYHGRPCSRRYTPTLQQLEQRLRQYPGMLWLIGNEPDAPLQDAVRPEPYVEFYHELYHFIKSVDPTAQVAIGGVIQATPLRMRWIEKVWYGYQQRYGVEMPVDVWNVHNFVLREVREGKGVECRPPGSNDSGDWGARIPPGVDANCGLWIGVDELDRMDMFEEQIIRFRRWMRDHGQRDKELIVSEYGILFNEELGYPYERVRDYMLATFDYFLNARDPELGMPADGNRLVQRWAWYSLNDTSFVWGTTWSALFNRDTREIMPLGEDFANYTRPLFVPYHDLAVHSAGWTSPKPLVYGQANQINLNVVARNWGNTASPPSLLRWWRVPESGPPLTIAEQSLTSVPMRYAGNVERTYTWNTIINGPMRLQVQLNADGRVSESNMQNNTADFAIGVNLKAVEVTAAPQVPTGLPHQAAQVTLKAKVQNTGDVLIPSHAVGFWRGDPASGEFLGETVVVNLAPGQTIMAELPVELEIGHHPIYVYVDYTNQIQESSNQDNRAMRDVYVVLNRELLSNTQRFALFMTR